VYARRVVRRALSEEAAVEARGIAASNRVEGCILVEFVDREDEEVDVSRCLFRWAEMEVLSIGALQSNQSAVPSSDDAMM
jgi:hypothetical protein